MSKHMYKDGHRVGKILVREVERPVPTIDRLPTVYESTYRDRDMQGAVGVVLMVVAVAGFVWGFLV